MYYKERQDLVWWVRYILILSLAVIILGLVLSPSDSGRPIWVKPFLVLVGLSLFFMFVNFRCLEIKVQGRFLEFGFGIFKKKFLITDISSCEETRVAFTEYLGVGIRRGLDGTTCYNTRFGKGVRIKVKSKKRDYVLTSDNPQALCQAVKAEW